MAAPQKFLFDTYFEPRQSGEGAGINALTKHQQEAHDAELEQAYEKGRRAGEASTKNNIDCEIAAALTSLSRSAQAADDTFTAKFKDIEYDAVQLAVATANKLAAELIEQEPTASLEAIFEDALSNLRSTPHIVLHVPQQLTSEIESRITAIAETHGYKGRIVVEGDPKLANGDCHIEWADGGVSKSIEDIRRAVTDTIECYLAARHGFFKDLDLGLLEEPADLCNSAPSGCGANEPIETGLEHGSGHAPAASGDKL